MQVQIIFTAGGCSSTFGNFAPGDVLRCSADQARHFVQEACCARYVDAPPAKAAGVSPPIPARVSRKAKG